MVAIPARTLTTGRAGTPNSSSGPLTTIHKEMVDQVFADPTILNAIICTTKPTGRILLG